MSVDASGSPRIVAIIPWAEARVDSLGSRDRLDVAFFALLANGDRGRRPQPSANSCQMVPEPRNTGKVSFGDAYISLCLHVSV